MSEVVDIVYSDRICEFRLIEQRMINGERNSAGEAERTDPQRRSSAGFDGHGDCGKRNTFAAVLQIRGSDQ